MSSSKASSTALIPQPYTADLCRSSEASCDSALLDPSRAYRLVLSSKRNPSLLQSDLESAYVVRKLGASSGEIRWNKPFGDKM